MSPNFWALSLDKFIQFFEVSNFASSSLAFFAHFLGYNHIQVSRFSSYNCHVLFSSKSKVPPCIQTSNLFEYIEVFIFSFSFICFRRSPPAAEGKLATTRHNLDLVILCPVLLLASLNILRGEALG